jgi:hypothetical protein
LKRKAKPKVGYASLFRVVEIGKYEGRLLVQRTDLSADQELLLLLHHAGEAGLSRKDLGISAELLASTVSTVLARLVSPRIRQVLQRTDGRNQLTELGSKRVREELAAKLSSG